MYLAIGSDNPGDPIIVSHLKEDGVAFRQDVWPTVFVSVRLICLFVGLSMPLAVCVY